LLLSLYAWPYANQLYILNLPGRDTHSPVLEM
jgi:hypothetical protein